MYGFLKHLLILRNRDYLFFCGQCNHLFLGYTLSLSVSLSKKGENYSISDTIPRFP